VCVCVCVCRRQRTKEISYDRRAKIIRLRVVCGYVVPIYQFGRIGRNGCETRSKDTRRSPFSFPFFCCRNAGRVCRNIENSSRPTTITVNVSIRTRSNWRNKSSLRRRITYKYRRLIPKTKTTRLDNPKL